MKFALTEMGITAAMTAAGNEGYVIPKEKMLNILAAAMPHLSEIEGEDAAEVIIPQAHTAHFEQAVETHIQALWTSWAQHERFLRGGLLKRLRWLFLGRR